MGKCVVAACQPDRLAEAPGAQQYLTADSATLDRGKRVFAETCARCHSGKLPDEARAKLAPGGCSGPGYLTCWTRSSSYTKTDEPKAKPRPIVARPALLLGSSPRTPSPIPATRFRDNPSNPHGTHAL